MRRSEELQGDPNFLAQFRLKTYNTSSRKNLGGNSSNVVTFIASLAKCSTIKRIVSSSYSVDEIASPSPPIGHMKYYVGGGGERLGKIGGREVGTGSICLGNYCTHLLPGESAILVQSLNLTVTLPSDN